MTVGQVVHEIFHSQTLRRRILFTIWILIVVRIAAHIPIPGANIEGIRGLLSGNQLLSIFSLLTGGGLEQVSVIMMGVSPYITASIIVQLLTVIVPSWEQISKDGERGRQIINRWSRILTIPLGLLQSYGLLSLLLNQGSADAVDIIEVNGPLAVLYVMFIVTCGSMLMLWLGDLITERGIGNGVSVLIFAGIVAGVPGLVSSYAQLVSSDSSQLFTLAGALVFMLAMIMFIVLISDARRQIPISYAGRSLAGAKSMAASSFLPIPVNQAGMIPIIFAVSLLALPPLLANFLKGAQTAWVAQTSEWVLANFTSNSPWYLLSYFLLIVAFTYFYVSVSFNPEQVAENIQKRSGFIPGIRPGKQTAEYLGGVSRRLTLLGALFIAIVAILPLSMQLFSTTSFAQTIPVLISGAGLIIIVGVVVELVRQVNAHLMMQDYEKFS